MSIQSIFQSSGERSGVQRVSAYARFAAALVLFVAGVVAEMTGAAAAQLAIQGKALPRVILGVYDSQYQGSPRFSKIHEMLEMPLNHLGFSVRYQDIRAPLPEIGEDIYGVILWLNDETVIEEIEPYLAWLDEIARKPVKFVLFNGLSLPKAYTDTKQGAARVNALYAALGVQDQDTWVNILYDAQILYQDKSLTGFERSYKGVLEPFVSVRAIEGVGETHLRIKSPQQEGQVSDLIVTSAKGAYLTEEYVIFRQLDEKGEVMLKQWYVNPFRLLEQALDSRRLPKPDVTTMNGRRIFYSHVDGDGWNNLSELEHSGKKSREIAARVLYRDVFTAYRDIPFSVAVIVSELRKDCYGLPSSRETAKDIFALPNVEPASHTYSHPLYWGFFATGGAEKEAPFMDKYPERPWRRFIVTEWLKEALEPEGGKAEKVERISGVEDSVEAVANDPLQGIRDPYLDEEGIFEDYITPRSYACEPFDLDREVRGSVNYIAALTDKPVKLYQWSGNTTPFEAAIAETRKYGLLNINGGDSRFDSEYPSYAWVAPISASVGKERQIYSSNSNEYTYTDAWHGRFFGFKYLQSTIVNTEIPRRVSPVNIYFHAYSGAKLASLNAVKENLKFVQGLEVIPLFASDYTAIAGDFFKVALEPLAHRGWRVLQRGNLQTIRFDHATLEQVDFNRSVGVLGQHYFEGALYVALDPAVENPEIHLKDNDKFGDDPMAERPYLISSNWKIKGLQASKKSLTFWAEGFGKGTFVWKMPQCGEYHVAAQHEGGILIEFNKLTGDNCEMEVEIPRSEFPLEVTVTQVR